MAFSEIEIKRCEKELDAFLQKHRPPPHIRDQLDLGYRIDGQSVELFEIRPKWKNPSEKQEEPVARTKYLKSRREWHVYWMRADLKWHPYDPVPEVQTLKEFLDVVAEDKHACFFG